VIAEDSRRPRRRLPSTEEYVLEDEREKESPLERLRRLRSEVAELEDEVRRNTSPPSPVPTTTEGTEETETEKSKGKKREVSPAVILQQLQMLRGDLKGLEPKLEDGVLEGTGEKDSEEETGEFESKAKASLGLLNKLGQDGTSGSNGIVVKPTTSDSAGPGTGQGELENRLSQLEKLIGANEADIDEVRLDQLKRYLFRLH